MNDWFEKRMHKGLWSRKGGTLPCRERQNGIRKSSKEKICELCLVNRYGFGRGKIYHMESTRKKMEFQKEEII